MIPGLVDRLRSVAAARPERVALRCAGDEWTYARLVDVSRSLAAELRAAGAVGGRVAVDLPTGPEHVAALLAVAWAGATAVPFDEKWTPAQAALRADLCEVSVVLHHGGGADDGRIRVGPRPGGRRAAEGEPVPFLLAATGGTSGVPKAVAISEEATLARFVTQTVDFGFSAATTFVSATPIFHGGGRSFILSQLYFGGTVEIHRRFEPAAYRAALAGADLTFAVPTMLERLAAHGGNRVDTRIGTTVLVSGAPLRGDSGTVLRAAGIRRAFDYYASVEAGPIGVRTLVDGEQVAAHLAFGVRLPDLPDGPLPADGVLLDGADVASRAVADGLLDADGFHPYPVTAAGERVVRMADRVRVLPGGALRVEGRTDDVIISGGVNVFPGEVEEALRRQPGIDDAVVVGVPDREWGQVVAAAVRTRTRIDHEALTARLRAELAGPQLPRRVVALDSFPLTSVGKTDRRRIQQIVAGSETA